MMMLLQMTRFAGSAELRQSKKVPALPIGTSMMKICK